MTPINRYLLQATFDWITDNQQNPHIMIDMSKENIIAPKGFDQDGKLVLSIDPQATQHLEITDDGVSFNARFHGEEFYVSIPLCAITLMYSKESGAAVPFPPMEAMEIEEKEKERKVVKGSSRSNLKLVK
jgi:stringent starvation protein B